MKKITLCLTATIATLATANIAAAQGWDGYYIGGNTAVSQMNVSAPPRTYSTTNIGGGIFAGYNHMISNDVMLGVEGEYNLNAATTIPLFPMDMKNTYGIRARVGYAMDSLLVYGAIGAEFGTFGPFGAPASAYDHTTGISMAAGLEYMLNERISVRAEYTRTNFGAAAPTTFGPSVTTVTESLRLGAAVHF